MQDNLEIWARGWLQRKILCNISFVAVESGEAAVEHIIE